MGLSVLSLSISNHCKQMDLQMHKLYKLREYLTNLFNASAEGAQP